MKSTPAPTTGKLKKSRPVTVIIDGDLAEKIRKGAKQLGFRAATYARQCITFGDLNTSNTDEAREFRFRMTLSEVHHRDRQFIEAVPDNEWGCCREDRSAVA